MQKINPICTMCMIAIAILVSSWQKKGKPKLIKHIDGKSIAATGFSSLVKMDTGEARAFLTAHKETTYSLVPLPPVSGSNDENDEERIRKEFIDFDIKSIDFYRYPLIVYGVEMHAVLMSTKPEYADGFNGYELQLFANLPSQFERLALYYKNGDEEYNGSCEFYDDMHIVSRQPTVHYTQVVKMLMKSSGILTEQGRDTIRRK